MCFKLSALPAAATNHFSHKHTYAQINQNDGSSILKYSTYAFISRSKVNETAAIAT